jgi:hypothetical protein
MSSKDLKIRFDNQFCRNTAPQALSTGEALTADPARYAKVAVRWSA